MLKKIESAICFARKDDGEMCLALDRSGKGPEECHLYMVTLTRNRSETHQYPATSNHFVLSPDRDLYVPGDEAIQQAKALAFPEVLGSYVSEHLVSASAARIPMIVRGYGVQPF